VKSSQLSNLFQENKTLFIIIIVGLFLLELEIFALANMNSGKESVLQVIDGQGNIIHETSGNNLSDFNKHHFEKVFGPLENYSLRLNTREIPFPFRAWFVAAICIPIGAMMLFGFVVKAYLVIFHGEKVPEEDSGSEDEPDSENRLASTLNRIGRMNIFNIGFLVFIGGISYWIIPNMITYLGHIGIDFFIQYEWVFIALVAIVVCVSLWIIYLRYLLARKSIESQTDIQKHRLSLEYNSQSDLPPLLEEPTDEVQAILEYKPGDTPPPER